MSNSAGSVVSGVAALANATSVGAYQLSPIAYMTQFSTVTAILNSCALPAVVAATTSTNTIPLENGQQCAVRNDGAFPLFVFPMPIATSTINGAAVGVPYIVSPGQSAVFTMSNGVNWLVTQTSLGGVSGGAGISKNVIAAGAVNLQLTSAQSGSLIAITKAAGVTITLPVPAGNTGCYFDFVQVAATAGFTVAISTGANLLWGNAIVMGAAPPVPSELLAAAGGNTTLNFLTNASVRGDHAHFWCDGVGWYCFAVSNIAAGMSFV